MENDDAVTVSVADLRAMMKETAVEAVNEAMLRFGIDPEKPLEMQKNMAYLQSVREGSKMTRLAVLTAVIGSGITALGTLLYIGFMALTGRPPT